MGVLRFVVSLFIIIAIPSVVGAEDMTTSKKVTKLSGVELKQKLSDMQYEVTQNCGTEPPFNNAYWNNKEPGVYVDVVSGEPLFSSLDKFDSGTGWPSFSKPIAPEEILTKEDKSIGVSRTEIRSRTADSHLGHVFTDGPGPNGMRYCVNSASLRFVPLNKMEVEGYGHLLTLFGVKSSGQPQSETAILAGGCFWGMQQILRSIPGITNTEVGYSGGTVVNPVYEMVTSGKTGHAESVRVTFDPAKISYEQLLRLFFRMHNPTTLNRQENDIGTQYRSGIFYLSDDQRKVAEAVKDDIDRSGKWSTPVVTEIAKAGPFFAAEDYHQDYLQKHPDGYNCHVLRD